MLQVANPQAQVTAVSSRTVGLRAQEEPTNKSQKAGNVEMLTLKSLNTVAVTICT